MSALSRFLTMLAMLAAVSAAVCAQTDNPPSRDKNTETVDRGSEYDLVHYGDVFEIDVVGSIDYDWRGTITPEGFLSGYDAPIDEVFALCKSPSEISEEIANALSKILRSPQVNVRIIDRSSRPLVILSGAVRVPQRFQVKRKVTLRELLVLSGGLTENASGGIEIYRPSRISCTARREGASADGRRVILPGDFADITVADMIGGKEGSDPEIGSGDVITVLEALPVYVTGGVVNPRPISTRSELTVSRAVATAGGLSKNADPTKTRIFRRKSGAAAVIEVDLEKIRSGGAPDVTLVPYDVIEVGERGRARSASPPFIRFDGEGSKSVAGLPLRIVD